ncbi:MAG: protein translocase subunit SecF, partial [Candidatus Pacebacteria bacterium]|nr:protein translocase subunit SecF [Candidatus Paceibacterota bacterium]
MFIIKNKFVFLTISAIFVLGSIICVAVFGLKLGIDFKGGTLLEVSYTEVRPETVLVSEVLEKNGINDAVVQQQGDKDLSIKSRPLSDEERLALVDDLSIGGKYALKQKSFNSIGPSVGQELTQKAITSIVVVVIAIVLYIAFAFRSVSKPVSSWKYGLIAITTLIHDIAIPAGVFAVLGHFTGAEVDTLFVVAILTVLGVSVSDTIVVFDRVRENLKNRVGSTFSETVGMSLNQTFIRSINTSMTVILVLLALYFFGPSTTKNFALVLIVGMSFGTYSSIFVASPLLVLVEQAQARKELKNKGK